MGVVTVDLFLRSFEVRLVTFSEMLRAPWDRGPAMVST